MTAMLDDRHGCRGLHQRRLGFAGGAGIAGIASGQGEAWYVISGSGRLDTGEEPGPLILAPGTAVWMRPGLRYSPRRGPALTWRCWPSPCEPDPDHHPADPARRVVRLDACEPERTGDREFRVLLSEGLTITQFAGLIPPGRAPAHHHTYDEVVHVLAGRGTVHLSDTTAEIGPGTSIYLPPYQPHCLENTGSDPLEVLGVFHPAGSPAAKRAS